jgi:hypothetical protein
MTTFWRTFILVIAGLGAAWAVSGVGSGPPTVFNTLDEASPSADLPAAPAPADAPTQEDIEAQIRSAEEALGDRADPNQELPVDPLRADVAIALPSDI